MLPQPRTGLLPATTSSEDLRRPDWQVHSPGSAAGHTHHPQSGPQTWERPRPAANPPSGALRGPFQGCHRGPRLLLSTRAPRSSVAQGPRFEAEPASASLSLSLLGILSTILFLRDFFSFFFFALRQGGCLATAELFHREPFSRDPLQPLIQVSPPAAPGTGRRQARRRAPGPKALPAARSRPGPEPSSCPAASRSKAHAMAKP